MKWGAGKRNEVLRNKTVIETTAQYSALHNTTLLDALSFNINPGPAAEPSVALPNPSGLTALTLLLEGGNISYKAIGLIMTIILEL